MVNNDTNNSTNITNETSPLTNTTVSVNSSGLTNSDKIALGLGIPTVILTIGILSLIAYLVYMKAKATKKASRV